MSELGCGTYQAFLQMRGGGGRIQIPTKSTPFSRTLNEMGQVTVVVPTAGKISEACCQALNGLKAWKHEVALHRDGVEVWAGPVVLPTWTEDQVTIIAKDVTQWFERRWLPIDRNITDDLGMIFNTIVSDAMSPDPSPNIACVAGATGIIGTRAWLAAEFRRAADELRELARTGIDYATIGHQIYIGGIEVSNTTLPTLTSASADNIVVVDDGQQTGTQVAVLGDTGIAGVAGAGSEEVGLVQNVYSEPTIIDATSAGYAATARYLATLSAESVTLRLLPKAPMTFAQLIPGVRVPLNVVVGCKSVLGVTLRLNKVDVQFTGDENADEIVVLELVPLGAGA